nr:glycoside hydrolase family 16 protein [uncultured Actinotalea sp.]
MTPPPQRLDRESFVLEVDETFDQPDLDTTRWLPHYLPHWSSREATRARCHLTGPGLVLRIDEDQQPRSPEYDGATRVSSLQTGAFSGPVGSSVGQHHFRPGLRVRHEEPRLRLVASHHGLVEVRAAACPHPDALVALWMIGLEDRPEHSAEICVMEVFGPPRLTRPRPGPLASPTAYP